MSALADKMRRARERTVEHAGHRYTVRIPTQGELEDLHERLDGKRLTPRRVALAFVTGWNLKEIDLIEGGRPTDAPFEAAAVREHLNAQPELCNALFAKISEGIAERAKQQEADAKN